MRPAAALVLVALLALTGCASERPSPGAKGIKDPLADMFNVDRTVRQRLGDVEQAWADTQSGKVEAGVTREQFKKALFLLSVPDPVRVRVTQKLLSDTSPEGAADVRNAMRLRLPRETNPEIIRLICEAAGERGWTDLTASIIRSWSRRTLVPDNERPERAALIKLHPGTPVERVVYDTFITQAQRTGTEGAAHGNLLEERIRTDAWELLGRLDKDGSMRATLLATDERLAPGASDAKADPVLADLRAAAADLKVTPITGAELEWIQSLRGAANPDNAAWWAQTARAVGQLSGEQTAGLQIRNLEPVRYCAAAHADWLSMPRPDLLKSLFERTRGRQTHARTVEGNDYGTPLPETLSHWESSLTWGDALSIMVIDEAIHEPAVVRSLFQQAEVDRKDKTTERGGAIEALAVTGAGDASAGRAAYGARAYTPAAGGVGGDMRFTPTEQLIAGSSRALAHYHFHAQDERNGKYAGPSLGDLEYAATYGRSCLVFTSIREGIMDIDYYQRNGVRIDLGELTRPPSK